MEVTNFQRFGRTTFDLNVRLDLPVRLVRLGWSRLRLGVDGRRKLWSRTITRN